MALAIVELLGDASEVAIGLLQGLLDNLDAFPVVRALRPYMSGLPAAVAQAIFEGDPGLGANRRQVRATAIAALGLAFSFAPVAAFGATFAVAVAAAFAALCTAD